MGTVFAPNPPPAAVSHRKLCSRLAGIIGLAATHIATRQKARCCSRPARVTVDLFFLLASKPRLRAKVTYPPAACQRPCPKHAVIKSDHTGGDAI